MNRRSSALFTLFTAAVIGVAGCSSSGSAMPTKSEFAPDQGNGSTFDGATFSTALPRPSFSLSDTAGKTVSFAQVTAKRPTLLYFGYTNCPDVCPTTMADVANALRKVPASVAQKTDVVFVSTDVKHDTAAVIKTWLHNFDADSKATWIGLRGTQAQVDAAQAAAHITLAEDGGQTHSSQMLLYGPDDYAHVFYALSNNEEQLLTHDLPLVAKGVTGT